MKHFLEKIKVNDTGSETLRLPLMKFPCEINENHVQKTQTNLKLYCRCFIWMETIFLVGIDSTSRCIRKSYHDFTRFIPKNIYTNFLCCTRTKHSRYYDQIISIADFAFTIRIK